jgi:hypothetical protein
MQANRVQKVTKPVMELNIELERAKSLAGIEQAKAIAANRNIRVVSFSSGPQQAQTVIPLQPPPDLVFHGEPGGEAEKPEREERKEQKGKKGDKEKKDNKDSPKKEGDEKKPEPEK